MFDGQCCDKIELTWDIFLIFVATPKIWICVPILQCCYIRDLIIAFA